nr:DUF4328 domain-containing protein [Streptomyces sp. SID3343]
MGYPGWRPAPRFRALRGLAISLYALLPVNAVFAVLGAIAFFYRADVLQQISDAGEFGVDSELHQRAEDSDVLVGVAIGFLTLSLVATAAVFIIWLHRARSNVDLFGPSRQRLHVGWTIGGWFLPIANLWFPKVILHDVWRASDARTAERGGRTPGRHPLLWTWWVLLVGSVVLFLASRLSYPRNVGLDDASRLETIDILSGAADIALVFAAIAAIFVVKRITRFQQQREAMAYASAAGAGAVPGAGGGAPWGGYNPPAPTGQFYAPQAPTGHFHAPQPAMGPTAPAAPAAPGVPPVPMAPGMAPRAGDTAVEAAVAAPEGEVVPAEAPPRPEVAPMAGAEDAGVADAVSADGESAAPVSLTKPVEEEGGAASVGADAIEAVDADAADAEAQAQAQTDVVEAEAETTVEPVVVVDAAPVVSFAKADADAQVGAEAADEVGAPTGRDAVDAGPAAEPEVDAEGVPEVDAEAAQQADRRADPTADSDSGSDSDAKGKPSGDAALPDSVAREVESASSGDRRG